MIYELNPDKTLESFQGAHRTELQLFRKAYETLFIPEYEGMPPEMKEQRRKVEEIISGIDALILHGDG